MNFNYYLLTKILFEKGKLYELGNIELLGEKTLIVISSGTSMKKLGYLDRVTKLLEKNNTEYVVFDRILPNPIDTHVMEGANIAKENNCDFVIRLGGGSSIESENTLLLWSLIKEII